MRPDNTFIAVVEDDSEIRDLTVGLLAREGYEVGACPDVPAFDRLASRRRIDLVLLDLMLPGEDGLSLCRRLRAQGATAILMVTARTDDIDRVVGLEIGADDYLGKPFNPRELVARVRAILRRTRGAPAQGPQASGAQVYLFEGWRLDAGRRDLTAPDGRDVALSGGEFDLLMCLLTHPQRVLSRDQLLDWTRGRNAAPYDRTIDVQLSRLRRKLGDPPDGGLIRTIRGGGYMLSAAVEREGAQ
ncbi:response regulator [Phenylobacterium sp.]|uniref:response regulator n=1 Tax=Phenylobacterium sp. TaxID=1871053 RepID=UPI0027317998|nr:response regulator [Phenylobacterium sp.]MDP1619302.1 response regulator [Phenylobacterium sp.]MDP1987899.1 response regulator [Phenylobacterium sp.]